MGPRQPVVRILGLGPGDVDLLTVGTRDLLAAADSSRAFLRTRIHPAARVAAHLLSFDDLYETASTFDEVYNTIVERVVAAATRHGDAVYVVPGSPIVAERTVELLIADERVHTIVEPALSFLDLAWVRLGIDPVAVGVRVVDGHRFAQEVENFEHALLIAQCHSSSVLSDIKLALDTDRLQEFPVATILHHLGLPDERIALVGWPDLDRTESVLGVVPDHLTSLYVGRLTTSSTSALRRLEQQMLVLRRDCPWDREQTHESLARYAVEEAYELADAIAYLDDDTDPTGNDPIDALESELGDLLFQVIFHCCLATERGWFGFDDVATTLFEKLERRHPHVFGEVVAHDSDTVKQNWEQIKREERAQLTSSDPFGHVPASLPSLLWASKIVKIAGARGVFRSSDGKPDDTQGRAGRNTEISAESIGERLLDLVTLAREHGIDCELALRDSARKLRDAALGN